MVPEQQAISRRAMLAGLGIAGLSLGLGTAAVGGASVTKAVYGGEGNGRGNGKGNCCADCLVVTNGFTYEAVQAVLDEAEGTTVLFQPGVYTFAGGTSIIRSNTTVEACGEVVIVQPNAGKFAGFAIEPGSANISIVGFDIRGPWFATGVPDWINGDMDTALWNASYAENIGIDIHGRWYQRQILGYNAAQMQALTDVSRNITIRGCTIEGFGQSGIIADNIDRFTAMSNTIRRCGRDGIRMYGVVDSQCISNLVSTLSPGYDGAKPNYNVYGITATRLYGSSAVPDPLLAIGRPSRNVDICLNHIENAYTWKGLDTHGGVNIRFAGNTVRNAYIAIGIDKGGINDTNGKAPGRDIAVTGNTLVWDGSAPYRRAGVTVYGHDTSDTLIGRNLTVTGNYITGYGGNSTDGAVSISNFAAVSVTGNVFANTFRAALTLFNTVIDFTFDRQCCRQRRAYELPGRLRGARADEARERHYRGQYVPQPESAAYECRDFAADSRSGLRREGREGQFVLRCYECESEYGCKRSGRIVLPDPVGICERGLDGSGCDACCGQGCRIRDSHRCRRSANRPERCDERKPVGYPARYAQKRCSWYSHRFGGYRKRV